MRRGHRSEGVKPVEAFLKQVMPPQFNERVRLEKAAADWAQVVGPQLGKRSAPTDLADGELVVIAETPLVGRQLSMMGGNISRALKERWGLEVGKVRVVVGRLPLKGTPSKGAYRPSSVGLREEEVQELKSLYSQDLPEDAAESLARLRLFFVKRFGK